MQKLINYIKKIGIDSDSLDIRFFGSHYFKNISCSYQAITIILDFTTYDARKLLQQEKMLKVYCNKYNYVIFNRGAYPGASYFTIMKKADRENLQTLTILENNSRDECNNLIHEYTQNGRRATHPQELDAKLKEIMQEYENNYFLILQEATKAAV